MGAGLNTAGASNAYVLSDRGTWIHFKNKGDLQERADFIAHAAMIARLSDENTCPSVN